MLGIVCFAVILLAFLLVVFRLKANKSHVEQADNLLGGSYLETGSSSSIHSLNRAITRLQSLKWKRLVFLDVETTGLRPKDRIVTIAAILFELGSENNGKLDLQILHRIYNPGIRCSPGATAIHGHTDWSLRHQPFFSEEAQDVVDFLAKGDVIVCHNAKFDLSFVNRELEDAGLVPLVTKSLCTMELYRSRFEGSARLDVIARKLNLRRQGAYHSALEDAWLTMNVFFQLQRSEVFVPFTSVPAEKRMFQNMRPVPPLAVGTVPSCKRRPRRSDAARVRSKLAAGESHDLEIRRSDFSSVGETVLIAEF